MDNLAALFPGQGSQSVNMGKDIFDKSKVAKELFYLADKILGYSISSLCFNGPIDKLTLTKNAQPALLTTSIALFREANVKVKAASGHSLGEYSALVASRAISFEDAVLLVHKRGTYMQEAVSEGSGKMIAVMGPTEEEILETTKKVENGVAEIANLNSPGQTVVSGDNKGIKEFSLIAKEKGFKIIPLKVSAPFHCSLMKEASIKLEKDLDNTSFSTPDFPIYSNVTASPSTNPETLKENLKAQVCGSVRWTDCIRNMVKNDNINHIIEFGPNGVLSKLAKRIDKTLKRTEIFDKESITKLLQSQHLHQL